MIGIFLKRIYEPYNPEDGYRVLVDRLWPRGISKERAQLAEWAKEIAPSTELRKWFGHDPEKFEAFRIKYLEELYTEESKMRKLEELHQLAKIKKVTLLFSTKNMMHNHAILLKELLETFTKTDCQQQHPEN